MSARILKPGSKHYLLASLHSQGMNQRDAFQAVRPFVINQANPWIYRANTGGARLPKSISAQLVDLQHDIGRVFKGIDEGRLATVGADVFKLETPISSDVEPEPEPITDVKPPRAKAKTRDDEKRRFMSEWRRIRAWIHSRAEMHGTEPLDSLDSLRPVLGAKAMINQGIPVETCIASMCLHWPSASKADAGIPEADFAAESGERMDGYHSLAGYVLKLAKARIPVFLIGPAGSGKSHLPKQIASLIKTEAHPNGLPYAEAPMTNGASRGDLLGKNLANGYIISKFVEIYSGGGVFNFEEIDAADPGMLIVINNALASDQMFNPVNGLVYDKHSDFIAFATGNTFGLGANAKYTGREKLDLATIDRFRMGRVLVPLDDDLADEIMFAD